MARWHGIWGFKYSARYSSFMSSVLFSVVPEPSKLGYQSVFHLLQCKMQLGPYKLILEHLKLEYYVQYPNSLSVGINVYWLHLLQCKMQLGPYRLILVHLKLEYCVWYPSSLNLGINLYLAQWFLMPIESKLFFFGQKSYVFLVKYMQQLICPHAYLFFIIKHSNWLCRVFFWGRVAVATHLTKFTRN